MRLGRRAFVRGALAGTALAAGCARTARATPPPAPRLPSPAAPTPSPPTAGTAAALDPANTFLLSVGVLAFRRADLFASFPTAGRRDDVLVSTLEARGVPVAHLARVRDAGATRDAILRELDATLARVPPGADLIVYYAGHGIRDERGATYFVGHDTDESFTSAVGHLELLDRLDAGFHGRRALLLADCCYSGALGETVAAHEAHRPYAVLASSLASEISTGEWTFTNALIDGLTGAPPCDVDRDGTVSLLDLAQYVEAEMAFADGQLATFRQTSAFPASFQLGPASAAPFPRFGERLEVRCERAWWPAHIVEQEGEGFRVHYVNTPDADDELVPPARMRTYQPEVHPVGTPVEVRWHRRWFPALVLEERRGVHRIHYVDFEITWDEWVSHERIRARRPR